MATLLINAGAFPVEANVNNNKSNISIKNVNIYSSSKWVYCLIKINTVPYKCVYAVDLPTDIPSLLELTTYDNRPSLLWNNMIIYQQTGWFEYQIEFILAEPSKNIDGIYKYMYP